MHVLAMFAHPRRDSFSGAILDGLCAGLTAAGHTVEVGDLYREGFDPRLRPEDYAQFEETPMPADVLAEQARIERADALAFVFPVWWWSLPGDAERLDRPRLRFRVGLRVHARSLPRSARATGRRCCSAWRGHEKPPTASTATTPRCARRSTSASSDTAASATSRPSSSTRSTTMRSRGRCTSTGHADWASSSSPRARRQGHRPRTACASAEVAAPTGSTTAPQGSLGTSSGHVASAVATRWRHSVSPASPHVHDQLELTVTHEELRLEDLRVLDAGAQVLLVRLRRTRPSRARPSRLRRETRAATPAAAASSRSRGR